jgi:PAT family beta-lactamase induction signal transducer AmpG
MSLKSLLFMLPLGFASGLPVALTGATLQAWLTVDGVDMTVIGLFSLAALPYTLKFLWSPLLDTFSLYGLGRRKGWILLSQTGVVLFLLLTACLSPSRHLWFMLIAAIFVACLSATQDMAIDAHRTEILREDERGLGASLTITGYRLAMLVSGGLALIMGEHIGWPWMYAVMAGIMAGCAVITFFAPEPVPVPARSGGLLSAIAGPVRELMSRRYAVWLLGLILLYKLGDAFAGAMTTPFLIRAMGFTPTEVGLVNKTIGLISAVIGGITGGAIMLRLDTYRALFWFGLLQAVSNLGFCAMAILGRNMYLFIGSVFLENFTGGMGTAAFVTLVMSLCHKEWTATQYALLSGIAAMGRVLVGAPSGWLVTQVGWPWFFFITFLVAVPGLAILVFLKKTTRYFC